MFARLIIGRLLAVLLIAGLTVAPLVTPAAARTILAEMSDMPSMSDDMPCCPDEHKSKDCQDCPLVAMCVFKTTQADPCVGDAILLRLPSIAAHAVLDDAPSHGLNSPPPDHPPRSLI